MLLENGAFGEAAREYERTAYEYAPHERASAAGYAAIVAHRDQLKNAGEDEQPVLKRATVDSSLKFAGTFPEHEHAPVVLGAAAEDLYALEDFGGAVAAGRTLIERYPAADVDSCGARRGPSSRTRRSSSPITRPPSPRTSRCSR